MGTKMVMCISQGDCVPASSLADVLVVALLQVLLDHFMQGKRLQRK
jgi:hypothetical protein